MAQVKLILREDVGKLGEAGDLVSVKPGYARNYLLRRGLATLATEARIKELEHQRRVIAEQQARALKDLEAVKQKIESTTIEVTATAGDEGRLFGSVTMPQVAELLEAKGISIDRRKLSTAETIKTTGEHEVRVQLRREMIATLKVVVTSTSAPAVIEAADSDETLNVRRAADDAEAASDTAADGDDEDDD